MNPRDRFALHLRKARLAAGLAQDELADRCYLHRTEVSLMEQGGRRPRLGTLIKLPSALGTTAGKPLRRDRLGREAAPLQVQQVAGVAAFDEVLREHLQRRSSG